MEIQHDETGNVYACKRFERVFDDDERSRRLIREIKILKVLDHPCCNQLKCVLEPNKCLEEKKEEFKPDLKYDEVYLVLKKCDTDLLRIIKSARHLEET